MIPNSNDSPEQAQNRAKFAAAFDVQGDSDAGRDPDHFEAPLLLQRTYRVKAQQDVADQLVSFGRLLSDDVLHTSEEVLTGGQAALDTARSIGENHSKFSQFLTKVFDALRNMTKAARDAKKKLQAARAAAKAADTKTT